MMESKFFDKNYVSWFFVNFFGLNKPNPAKDNSTIKKFFDEIIVTSSLFHCLSVFQSDDSVTILGQE